MKTNKKIFSVIAISMLAVLMVGTFAALTPKTETTQETGVIKFSNYIEVRKNGELVGKYPNTVTNVGKNHTRDVLAGLYMGDTGAKIQNMTVLELSWDSNVTATSDANCTGAVINGSLTISKSNTVAALLTSVGNYSVQKQWTATGTVSNIKKVCIGNSTTSGMAGSLFASALLSSAVNMESGDQLTVTYFVAVS